MKSIYIAIVCLCLFKAGALFSQPLIAVQNGGTPKFFTRVDSAINQAKAGDTLYIPGGITQILNGGPSNGGTSAIWIRKELHIIGPGYHPDSAVFTGIADLSGYIYLRTGSTKTTISGLKISTAIRTDYTGTDTSSQCIVERCRIAGVYLSRNAKTILFRENNIAFITGARSNQTIMNNILEASGVSSCDSVNFYNNIFWGALSNMTNCTFNNNIFIDQNVPTSGGNFYFNNISTNTNLNSAVGSSDNYKQTKDSIFIKSNSNTFTTSNNFHLGTYSKGKNAGIDGKDIGIYGGYYPWKDGGLPPNPHLTNKVIAPTADINKKLKVKVTVNSQSR